jgi:hypothetical protein
MNHSELYKIGTDYNYLTIVWSFSWVFSGKGLKHLQALEPCVKAAAEKQHIDYHFSGLDDDSDIDDYSSYQDNHSDGSEFTCVESLFFQNQDK